MKFKLILSVFLVFISCSGDGVEDETIFNNTVWVKFPSGEWRPIDTYSEIGNNRGENPETNSEIKKYFQIMPKIAVLGFNPHAGEEGQLGDEEISSILPAILKFKECF